MQTRFSESRLTSWHTLVRSNVRQELTPFVFDHFSFFGAEHICLGKLAAPGKRLTRVDEHAAHREIARLAFRR
jgi:hypothetical protein